MKSSPRHHVLSLREEEQRDQSFIQGFAHEKKRQSPTDLFSSDQRFDFRRNSRKSPDDHLRIDSDEDISPRKSSKQKDFQKSQHSPTMSEKSHSRRDSHRSKDGTDQSENDDDEQFHKQARRTDFTKHRQSTHDQKLVSFIQINQSYHSFCSFSHRQKILIQLVFIINLHPVVLDQLVKKKLNLLDVHPFVMMKIQLFLH